ncbi:MAG TPA: LURP-one-related family protein [Euzebyales bacterium]|nr:LURP-one-related family protein [Euzebyales bacterium]
MFRRRRHREQAEQAPEVYQIRERLVDIGDDYWIETAQGRRAFKVDGKVLRLRDTFAIQTPDGTEVARLQERMARVRDTFKIERPGKPDATVKKALISPFRDRWVLEADDVGELKVQGNIVDHEYTFETEDGRKVAETSKRWFRVRDTYGVQIDPMLDAALILAATVAIDQMSHD